MNAMRIRWTCVIYLLIAFSILGPAATAQNGAEPLRPFRTDASPVIDGKLDDPVWKQAPVSTDFKTWNPDFGLDMAEQTRVYYAYDRHNLYFAYRCYDRDPSKLKASISQRDAIRPDDWVAINLDSFNDQQSLYTFYVNPLGIQMDARYAAGKEDYGFDAVWYSAGTIDGEGYTVEIRIPLQSIRYSQKSPVEMGVIFERRITRHSQMGTFPPLDPKKGDNWLIQTLPLIYPELEQQALVELLPGFTFSHKSSAPEGRLVSQGHEAEFGLTGKYGITSHLILDATYNPDFSQVEADAGQVDFNQRYALFYPEKRPFFLEGMEIFNFGGSYSGDYLREVVHTRSIVNPLVGTKVSGKIGDRNTIAALYAMDELPDGGTAGDYAHFSIFRYKRALAEDSHVGGFYAERRDDTHSNRVAGADGQLRIGAASRVGYHAFLSQDRDRGLPSAGTGYALGLDYFYSTRDMTIMLGTQDISEGFRTDTGFVTRTGVTRFRSGVLKPLYPKSRFLQRIDPMVHSTQIRDRFSGRFETENRADLRLIFPRSSSLTVGWGYSTEIFQGRKFDTRGFRIVGSSQFTKEFYASFQYRRSNKIRYVENPYGGSGNDVTASLRYQPTEKIETGLSLTFSDFSSGGAKEFDYTIARSRNTYQLNRYVFFRAIFEYNSFWDRLTTDFLASFTYIPGTVVHFGYGSLFERLDLEGGARPPGAHFTETARSFFFKASYLWRL